MFKQIRPALLAVVVLTVITGIVYPLVVTGLAQLLFPGQANGSLVRRDGQILGSTLVGQNFDAAGYFWGRPSATSPGPYNAAASSGSNLGPSNLALRATVEERVAKLHAADPGNAAPIPIDLVTTAASGLDPHISPAAALWQVGRVARERGLPESDLRSLVARHTEGRTFGLLGEPRVNVLQLNLALDAQTPRR